MSLYVINILMVWFIGFCLSATYIQVATNTTGCAKRYPVSYYHLATADVLPTAVVQSVMMVFWPLWIPITVIWCIYRAGLHIGRIGAKAMNLKLVDEQPES